MTSSVFCVSKSELVCFRQWERERSVNVVQVSLEALSLAQQYRFLGYGRFSIFLDCYYALCLRSAGLLEGFIGFVECCSLPGSDLKQIFDNCESLFEEWDGRAGRFVTASCGEIECCKELVLVSMFKSRELVTPCGDFSEVLCDFAFEFIKDVLISCTWRTSHR